MLPSSEGGSLKDALSLFQVSYPRDKGNWRAGSAEMTLFEKALWESDGHRAVVLCPQKSGDFKHLVFSSGLFSTT